MAVERVVACWQQLQHVRACCARSEKDIAWAKFWARREEQTHRMYDTALKAFTIVSGLQLKEEPSGGDHVHVAPAQQHVDAGVPNGVSKSNGHAHDGGELDLTCAKKKPACEAGRFNGHNRIAAFLEPVGLGVEG